MKQILTNLFFLTVSISLFGQNLEKGIYVGKGHPNTICYLTYSDSIIEVEYFYEKGSQVFGHTSAKKLEYGMESFSTKPIFVSKDDSIKVFMKSDHYLVKREGYEKIKVYKSSSTPADIRILRNRNTLFSFSQKLYNENRNQANFESQKFWNEFNSYGLENKTNLSEIQFDKKLMEAETKIKNWLKNTP